MATSKAYLDFVLDCLSAVEDVRVRPMMGEYLLYAGDKLVGGVYDNRLMLKAAAAAFVPEPVFASPYPGAKPMLLVTCMDDREALAALVRAARDALPPPKPRGRSPQRATEKE